MKMKYIIIVSVILAIVISISAVLYKHFVAERIKDRGGMENPTSVSEEKNNTI